MCWSLDLPFAQPLDSVVPASDGDGGASAPMHVYGAVQRATLAGADKVTMRFASNSTSIAAAERKVGDGHAVWCGFLPVSAAAPFACLSWPEASKKLLAMQALSYFQPALPRRPIDRNMRDDSCKA